MKKYTKKQITESETGFDHQPPTALELVEAVFSDEDYSPKLALQARVWVEVEAPHDKRQYDSGIYSTGIKRGQIVPWLFPVVDVKQRGRSEIALVCSKPSMHHEALTFMELKTKFLDAKVRRDDIVTAECGGLPVGDIVAVNVHAGRIPGEGRYYGGGQHIVVIKCIGSQEFTKSRDEGRLGAADIRESSCKYTKKQITEAIAYWENRLKMMTENDHKWNPTIEKIVSSFQPRVHNIEGVSLPEFGSEDPVKLAKKLYASLASKNGLTGTRYVPGGYSHAGFDYHNYLDGDFKLYFNDQPTFTFRHMVLKKRDTEWIPDGNPYDGVCPKTVWRTMANSCAIAVKPGFKMADLKNVEKGMKVVNSQSQKFEVSDADYPFYTLRWLFQAPYVQSWVGNAEKKYYNYLNFVSYEAGPFLTRKIQSLGAIAGEDLVNMTQQIVKMAGVDKALEPGKGDVGQTTAQFKSMRDYHRTKVLQPALKRKKNEAAAQSKIAELKKLIGSGITYGELYDRKDFPSIVTAVLTSSKPYHWTSPTADDYHDALYTCSSDIELGRHQHFREEAYNEAFFEEMDAAIESFIDDAEDLPVDYTGFEGKIVDAADEANNNVDTSNYIEDEKPEPDWYDYD